MAKTLDTQGAMFTLIRDRSIAPADGAKTGNTRMKICAGNRICQNACDYFVFALWSVDSACLSKLVKAEAIAGRVKIAASSDSCQIARASFI